MKASTRSSGWCPASTRSRSRLPGFNTVRREGIELTASFTATVNADLRVGALEETVTVTGASPTVDVQNVVQQRVITREVINAIPAGTKSVAALGVLIPGVVTQTQDVGGTAFSATAIAIHGSRFNEQQLLYDGVFYNHGAGSGGNFNTIVPNDATVQEVSLEVGGTSAESPTADCARTSSRGKAETPSGARSSRSFTDDSLQATNLSDDLQALGLVSVPEVTRIYDINPAFGGPVVARQTLVLRLVSEAELAADGRRSLFQPDADRARIHTRLRPAGAEQRGERQLQPATHVAGQRARTS